MSTESSGQVENLRTSSFMNVLSKLIHDPMGAFGLLIVISFLIVAIFADVLAPYDPN